MDALLLRLQVLLAQGDLERSSALQNHLLAFFAKDPETGVEPATEMAITYLSQGLKLDARDFLVRAADGIPGVRSADNLKLFNLVGQVIDGWWRGTTETPGIGQWSLLCWSMHLASPKRQVSKPIAPKSQAG